MNDDIVLGIARQYSDEAVAGLEPPAVTLETITQCREFCAKNDCGCYGKFCSCPPLSGSAEERLGILGRYSKSALVPITYDVDWHDMKAMQRCNAMTQNVSRSIMLRLKDMGIDCLGLADGGCAYCPTCAAQFGKPCAFPEMQIQSVSGNGIIVNDYLAQCGRKPLMEDGRIELYAIILYN